MVRIYKIFFISCMLASVSFGCSPKEEAINPISDKEVGTIQFGGILKELTGETKIQVGGIDAAIPECNDNKVPKYVRIALRKGGSQESAEDYIWVKDNDDDEDYFIDIPVVPLSNDHDEDGKPNFLTMESAELALPSGEYTLEYFAVLNSENDIIMVTPRKDQDYGPAQFQNFVEMALPVSITIQEGTKQYLQIETLCYDEVFAFAYGYLFFDFERVKLTNLCVFGNVCDENKKDSPAHYRLKVWEFNIETNLKGRELVNGTNNVDFSSSNPNEHVAEPLCVPLPDRQGTDYYYGEIYLIKDGNETLIRQGEFTDSDISPLYDETEDLYTPYHFRESCCGLLDAPELLNYVTEPLTGCEPNDPPQSGCETAYMFGNNELNDLGLNGNKWGWAEHFEKVDGTYTYDFWADAGKNDLSKGTLVGEITLIVDGEEVTININLNEGCSLKKTHVYLSDDEPTTSAPGQYGNIHENLDSSQDTYDLSYSGDGDFWVIVHAEVCCEIEDDGDVDPK